MDKENKLYKVLEFLCKIAKEKDIYIEFGPTFIVRQYRTNPENGKSYKISQIIDVNDLIIKNVTFSQVIDEIVRHFDDQFNDMFKEEENK